MRSVSASFNLATMSLLCCCLCLQTLPTDRRKRKKLNGTGCTRAREVLTSMSTSSHECLEIMLQNGDAALCINCDSVLINISKYEQKLESLKKDMMEKVSIVMDQGLHSSNCQLEKDQHLRRLCPRPRMLALAALLRVVHSLRQC